MSEQNLTYIREAGKICYTDTLSDCVNAATAIDQQLRAIDFRRVGTIYFADTHNMLSDFYMFPYDDGRISVFNNRIMPCGDGRGPCLQDVSVFNPTQIIIPRDRGSSLYIAVSAASNDQGKTYQGTAEIWTWPSTAVTVYAIELGQLS